jgi:hypothetical protein
MSSRNDSINRALALIMNPKQEVVRINISSSFMSRTLCKDCGKGPDYYYASMRPFRWREVKYFRVYSKISNKWVKRMVSDWYLQFQPRYFNKMGDFSFTLESRDYNPALFKTRGSDVSERDNVVEYVGCECGATVWAFNDKSTKKRPEITNRKGRYKYPQKFAY